MPRWFLLVAPSIALLEGCCLFRERLLEHPSPHAANAAAQRLGHARGEGGNVQC